MKSKFLVALFVIFSALSFTATAFGCAISCAAICRYTCEGSEQPANCSNASYATALQNCCEGAFRNTPGINDVPCTVSGPQN